MDIGRIDTNFCINPTVTEPDVVFRDVLDTSAVVFGLHDPQPGMPYRRLPAEVAQSLSPAINALAQNTSGGRCRFQTDSAYVAVRVYQHFPREKTLSHMTFLGSSGFDLYVRHKEGYVFYGSLIPPADHKDGYEAIYRFPDRTLRDITLNFPLYNCVQRLELGLQQDAVLLPPPAYSQKKPVVFYGSSITQGGCASRPGACYPAILSRRLDFDYYNFGFSGNCLGEPELARYLAQFDASAFILDYDYNTPNADHLGKTHWNFYSILRKAHPNMPILILPACQVPVGKEKAQKLQQRRDVIRATYDHAIAAGDRRLWWLEGRDVFSALGGNECTVDGLHPTDLGFWAMANAIEPFLRQMLQIGECV